MLLGSRQRPRLPRTAPAVKPKGMSMACLRKGTEHRLQGRVRRDQPGPLLRGESGRSEYRPGAPNGSTGPLPRPTIVPEPHYVARWRLLQTGAVDAAHPEDRAVSVHAEHGSAANGATAPSRGQVRAPCGNSILPFPSVSAATTQTSIHSPESSNLTLEIRPSPDGRRALRPSPVRTRSPSARVPRCAHTRAWILTERDQAADGARSLDRGPRNPRPGR